MPAIIAGAVAALAFGAFAAMFLGSRNDHVGSAASPTPTASAPADSTEPPPTSGSPTPSPTASPTPLPMLVNLAIVEVTTDGLNLRGEPGTDASVIGVLDAGARLFVIGQPQVEGGESWYRVAVVGGPYSECEPSFCPDDIGWVAAGAEAHEPYLAEASVNCPPSPMTAVALGALHALERLSCYGSNPIVVIGTLDYCYCDGPIGPVTYEPLWLAMPVSQFVFHGTPGLWLRFEDDTPGPDELAPGDVVEATVAMEHVAAPECSVSGPEGGDMPTQANVILDCRTQLVVESLTVTGHDPSVGS